jgi:hypothetical protein
MPKDYSDRSIPLTPKAIADIQLVEADEATESLTPNQIVDALAWLTLDEIMAIIKGLCQFGVDSNDGFGEVYEAAVRAKLVELD